MSIFVHVLLPLRLSRPFTYHFDGENSLKRGQRVIVPFGKRKRYTGIVWSASVEKPPYETKSIEGVFDDEPVLTEIQLNLWEWLARHYMTSLGEVMRTAMVSGLLIEDELNAIDSARSSSEVMLEKSLPKNESWIELVDSETAQRFVEEAKAVKQVELIRGMLELVGPNGPIPWRELQHLTKSTAAVRNALVKKGILMLSERPIERLKRSYSLFKPFELTAAQQQALNLIEEGFETKKPVVLKGVTGSGKTEVYMLLIEKALSQSGQVLYLLPEIALTEALTLRVSTRFPEKVLAYNSALNKAKRVEAWHKVLKQDPSVQIVVGSRSALFLPFSNLRLIIVDEEHDTSFKQADPAPRYHARDTAIYLAQLCKASIVLGSATPSLETYYNATPTGAGLSKYTLVNLQQRYAEAVSTHIELIDLREEYKRKRMHGFFSQTLLNLLDETLERGEQALFFQNRRGYSTLISCQSCGHVKRCQSCDVGLTYHKGESVLRCHYCGFQEPFTVKCSACGSLELHEQGLGTEQLEWHLAERYPQYSVIRVDSDSGASLSKRLKALKDFEAQRHQILVGTQMISKGIDFSNIGLIGVVQVDQMLYRADYRAQEQAFQMLLQVAGRGGRHSDKPATMALQTFDPGNRILRQLVQGDDKDFYSSELEERKQFFYPPFSRMIRIQFRAKSESVVWEGASWFAKALKQIEGIHVLGNDSPIVSKIRDQHYQQILIKYPKKFPLHTLKARIQKIQQSFEYIGAFQSIRIAYHVDHI
jgi:primosomal protein N' (replication factor Y) (superfamily II helicase)